MALELRPNCECCDKDLPPSSSEAMICTYECTFCSDCMTNILHNVCPNCGGGFEKRPIRPATERRPGLSIFHQPAGTRRRHTKYTREELIVFGEQHKHVPADKR